LCDSGKLSPERFVINAQKVESTIVFMPLKKRVEQQPIKFSGKQKKSARRQVIDYDKYQKKLKKQQDKQAKIDKLTAKKQAQKVVVPSKPVVPIVPPVVAKPVVPTVKPTLKKAVTSVKVEVVTKKPEVKKPAPKQIASFTADKKKEQKKVVVPEKKEGKKIEVKAKVDQAIKKEAVKPVEQSIKAQEQVVAPVAVAQVVQQQVVVEEKVQELVPLGVSEEDVSDEALAKLDEDDLGENVTFVGSHDLEMLQIQEQIKAQVAQHYKPPVGIAKKAVCELAVLVGMDGKPQQVKVKKGSGSMANDMCARAALLKVTFPKKVFGKEIIVELGQ
jgi:hypothetical protein